MTATFEGLRSRIKPEISARDTSSLENERPRTMKENGDRAVAEPFRGISERGAITPGLFPLRSTGVSTRPILDAANAFLASLSAEQRAAASFPIDSDEWRRWSNVHMFLMRHGVCMEQMTETQRERAYGLMRATLSKAGFETSLNVMRLNETIREITGRNTEFGDLVYWFSVFGTPSEDGPWGWQVDGHHLILNCFVLGDQVVLAPQFVGSEPVIAPAGKYAGARVFDAEQERAIALIQSLDAAQRERAIISDELPREVIAAAFSDNIDLARQGLRLDGLSEGQKELASSLLDAYVGRLRDEHAAVWQQEVERYMDETYLAWVGGTHPDGIFYYRLHSPVVLIEFDHLPGVALDFDVATRHHIHTILRAPNGNDYGRDLLRQHYERHPHAVS